MPSKASTDAAPIKVIFRAHSGDGPHHAAANGVAHDAPKAASTPDVATLQKQLSEMQQQQEKWATERKKLQDDLKEAKADRRRAEDLLARANKEVAAVKHAKARVEESFLRTLRELQSVKEERDEANDSANQMLSDMIEIQDRKTKLEAHCQKLQQQLASLAPPAPADTAPVSHQISCASTLAPSSSAASDASNSSRSGDQQATCRTCGADASSRAAAAQYAMQASNKKNRNLKQVLRELQLLREAKVAAETQRAGLQEELNRLRREKELAEDASDMITRQTQVLLQDKLALVQQIEAKDDLARRLEGGLHQLAHQLECAMADRATLLQQLAIVSPKYQQEEFHGEEALGLEGLELGTSGEGEGEGYYGMDGLPMEGFELGTSEGEAVLQQVLSMGAAVELGGVVEEVV